METKQQSFDVFALQGVHCKLGTSRSFQTGSDHALPRILLAACRLHHVVAISLSDGP